MKRTIIISLVLLVIGIGFYLGYRQARMAKHTRFYDFQQSTPVNYESWLILASQLSNTLTNATTTNKIPVTKQDIELLCGKPDAIDSKAPKLDNWHYRITDDKQPQYYDITISFDKSGKMIALVTNHQMIDPATVTIVITEPYWQDKVVAQIDPKYLSSQNKQYTIDVEARAGNDGYVFSGPNKQAIPVDRKYERRLFPGIYSFYLVIMDTTSYRRIQEILLAGNVQLTKNETKQFDF
jgi:hypothetical protein